MQNNKKDRNQKQPAVRQAAFIFTIFAAIFLPAWFLKLYSCPLEGIFGVPCPLCGITRAFRSLAAGDIRTAFYYHPLWPVILAASILYVLYIFRIIRVSPRVFTAACFVLGALLLGCFILRHIYGSPVVQISFDDSPAGMLFYLIF